MAIWFLSLLILSENDMNTVLKSLGFFLAGEFEKISFAKTQPLKLCRKKPRGDLLQGYWLIESDAIF